MTHIFATLDTSVFDEIFTTEISDILILFIKIYLNRIFKGFLQMKIQGIY